MLFHSLLHELRNLRFATPDVESMIVYCPLSCEQAHYGFSHATRFHFPTKDLVCLQASVSFHKLCAISSSYRKIPWFVYKVFLPPVCGSQVLAPLSSLLDRLISYSIYFTVTLNLELLDGSSDSGKAVQHIVEVQDQIDIRVISCKVVRAAILS